MSTPARAGTAEEPHLVLGVLRRRARAGPRTLDGSASRSRARPRVRTREMEGRAFVGGGESPRGPDPDAGSGPAVAQSAAERGSDRCASPPARAPRSSEVQQSPPRPGGGHRQFDRRRRGDIHAPLPRGALLPAEPAAGTGSRQHAAGPRSVRLRDRRHGRLLSGRPPGGSLPGSKAAHRLACHHSARGGSISRRCRTPTGSGCSSPSGG